MASSRLRALILRLARLALIAPIGHFILGIVSPKPPMQASMQLSPNSENGLKVIACGFCRSGTRSLKLALDRLGFECYHGRTCFWTPAHAKLWLQAAAEGKRYDWQRILQGYRAVADYPAACFYKELMAAFPNAKVILNVRDPEQWYRSCKETVFRATDNLLVQIFHRESQEFLDTVLWRGKFEGRFDEKEFAINVYKSHVEDVKRSVPKDKLLVYEAKDGWAPLCDFLQADIPTDTPYPNDNDSVSFRNRVIRMERNYTAILAVYVGVMSCALALLLKRAFEFCVESS